MGYSNHCAESVLIPHISIRSTICITSRRIPEGVLRQKYLVDRLSMRDIAREFACSKTHIRDLLLKYNIPLRQPNIRHNKWYAYGKRRVSGKTIYHKGELRTIHHQADVLRRNWHERHREVLEHHEDTYQTAG